MRVCYDDGQLRQAMSAVSGSVLVDRFVENAVEIDVDALCDGEDVFIAAVMQHVEEAGVHSGDSSCVLPAQSLTLANALEANDEYTSSHARSLRDMALAVGGELGLDARTLKRLELGALARMVFRPVREPLVQFGAEAFRHRVVRGITDQDSTWAPGQPELRARIDRDAASAIGLTAAQTGLLIRSAILSPIFS